MSPITNLAMTLLLLVAACGTDTAEPPPTYSELYDRYFAAGTTPGHCANAGCHGDPNHVVWLCGPTKDTCYAGMVSSDSGLINTAVPRLSLIADPASSPLSWIHPGGQMPFDTPGPFPEGRDAILAWVFAGALDD